MSLIIKGMDMPATCKCNFSETEYKGLDEFCMAMKRKNVTKYANDDKGRHPQCPLVELPENHGRLIDADRLLAVLKSLSGTSENVPTKAVIGLIEHQPIIFEQE